MAIFFFLLLQLLPLMIFKIKVLTACWCLITFSGNRTDNLLMTMKIIECLK